jgi:hypothetical protein
LRRPVAGYAAPIMDWEGKVVDPKLVCAATGQPIAPGALFFSGLSYEGGTFARRDFSAEAWTGQDQQAFVSWWRQKAPVEGEDRRHAIDAEALARIFAALKDAKERPKQCFVYIVVLFLMRAKKLRFVESRRDGDRSWITVEDRAQGVVHRVRDPQMSNDELEAVQRNLLEVVASTEQVESG